MTPWTIPVVTATSLKVQEGFQLQGGARFANRPQVATEMSVISRDVDVSCCWMRERRAEGLQIGLFS